MKFFCKFCFYVMHKLQAGAQQSKGGSRLYDLPMPLVPMKVPGDKSGDRTH
jgi:hypothetical protein